MKKKLKTNPRTLVEDEISRSLSREDSPLDSLEVWLDWDSWPWCMAVAPRTAPKNGASGARLKNLVKSWFSDSSRLVLQEMVLLGFWKWCDKRWCSVRAWGYSWPRGLLHWEPSKQKKRINSDHGPTGLGCDKRTQRTLHELFTQKRMFFKLSDYHIPIPWRILTVLLFLWCATWIPTKTPVMLAFFYQHQPDPSWLFETGRTVEISSGHRSDIVNCFQVMGPNHHHGDSLR